MSYRTVKRLLGETSLERKSRYLFGGSLLLLITASFYVYARLTSDLVYDQNPKQAQKLIYPIILEKHIQKLEPAQTLQAMQLIIDEMRPSDLDYKTRFIKPDVLRRNTVSTEPEFRPSDAEDYDAVDAIVKGPATEYPRTDKDSGEYQFFAAVTAQKACAQCHRELVPSDAKIKEGDLMRVVKITLPLK